MATLEERYLLLAEAEDSPKIQAAHYELCKRDFAYWCDNFCYTYDPRTQGNLPFNLYAFQEWFAKILIEKIEAKEDVLVEKSRDMGATYTIIYVFQWYWLFHKGSNFLMGSLTEEDVDRNLIDPSDTLFGKLRYNLQFQPPWIIDKSEIVDKHLILQNKTNGNTITGRAPVANFGRGQRQKAMLFDEIPHWQHGRSAFASASMTANCRILNGTPNTKFDIFGEIANDKSNRRRVWPGRDRMRKAKGINIGDNPTSLA